MFRRIFQALTVFAVVAATAGLLASGADARPGGGFSMGSRGSRTFSSTPSTSTMPSTSQMQRTTTQPSPGYGQSGGFFGGSRPGFFGGGFLGSLAAGFIGAGLFGLLFGHGLFGGLGGITSLLGLVFQIGLIWLLASWAWRWFQGRNAPAYAGAYREGSPYSPYGASGLGAGLGAGLGSGLGGGAPQRSDDIGINTADYDAFERLLGEIQTAYSNEDLTALRTHATPEMVSYFSEELAENASRGVVNRVSGVKLLQGDLAEAWREGGSEYATVAMRFALNDTMVERATGRVIEGGPQEVAESWTFRRNTAGGPWMLSAIQQAGR
jgi:predicted lipid-binding transport protein (Tim44 family)